MKRITAIAAGLALAAGFIAAPAVHAQAYPSKPLRLLVQIGRAHV